MVSDILLLVTKLQLPPPGVHVLRRALLKKRLSQGLAEGHPLLLLAAPAGYGKTTLAADWLREVAESEGTWAAWVSLEASENDPVTFWSYLIAALQSLHPEIGRESLGLLRSAKPPPLPVILSILLNEMARLDRRTILVLDNFHTIENRQIVKDLAFWLEHFPTSFHLLIATRVDPFLPLSRLRARRMLLELRLGELRFSTTETKAYFQQVAGIELTEAQTMLLEKAVEGWPAGLQLAALSLRETTARGQPRELHEALQAYDSSDRHILDFFSDEVLQTLAPDRRRFLHASALFDRFCARLCDEALEIETSAKILAELEQKNLFIIPLDTTRSWYRYHHLFSDLLRRQLAAEVSSDTLRELHRRAAHWFEGNALDDEGIEHFLKGRDYASASRVVSRIAYLRIFAGERATVLRWLAAFPGEWSRHPGLLVIRAWLALAAVNLPDVERALEMAENALAGREEAAPDEAGPGEPVRSWSGQLATIRATLAFNLAEIRESRAYAERALAYLGPDESLYRCLVLNCLGDIHFTGGNIAEARKAYQQGYDNARSAKVGLIALLSGSMVGNSLALRGYLQQAGSVFESLMSQVEAAAIPLLPAYAAVEEGIARLFLEWNRLEEAAAHACTALERIARWDHAEITLRILLTLVEVSQARGQMETAAGYLELARQLYRERLSLWPYPRLVDVEARWLIAHGKPAQAEALLRSAYLWPDLAVANPQRAPHLVVHGVGYRAAIEVLLLRGDAGAALQLSEWALSQAEEQRAQAVALPLKLLHALAQEKLGRQREAVQEVGAVLRSAVRENYCRLFLSAGNAVTELLAGWLRENPADNPLSAYCRSLLEVGGTAPVFTRQSAPPSGYDAYEALSAREVEVLRLVAAGQTNDEIAATLYLSTNTVKTHLKRIFAKLGATNRLEAVNHARELEGL